MIELKSHTLSKSHAELPDIENVEPLKPITYRNIYTDDEKL